jgi:hypothetical protein
MVDRIILLRAIAFFIFIYFLTKSERHFQQQQQENNSCSIPQFLCVVQTSLYTLKSYVRANIRNMAVYVDSQSSPSVTAASAPNMS